MPCAVRPYGFDRDSGGEDRGVGLSAKPKARRDPVLEHLQDHVAGGRLDPLRFVVINPGTSMAVAMTMAVVMIAAEQPGAGNVDGKPKGCDRDGLSKLDRHRIEQATDGLVTNQQRDHRQDDGAGKSGEIAEFSRAECKSRVAGVSARVGIGEGCEQQCARMRAHMKPIGDQRDRSEQPAADNLGNHHDSAEPDHRPGPALALVMVLAEEHVAMECRITCAVDVAHGVALFRLFQARPGGWNAPSAFLIHIYYRGYTIFVQ